MTSDTRNEPYYDANRARWDESVPIHAASDGYDLAGFLRGEKTLYAVEMDEVGDVRGKALLHLLAPNFQGRREHLVLNTPGLPRENHGAYARVLLDLLIDLADRFQHRGFDHVLRDAARLLSEDRDHDGLGKAATQQALLFSVRILRKRALYGRVCEESAH